MSQTTPAAVTGISLPVHLTQNLLYLLNLWFNRFSGIQTAPSEPGQDQGLPGAEQSPDSVRTPHRQSTGLSIQSPGQRAICAGLSLFSIFYIFKHKYCAFELEIK